jgi:hypothetical protein
LADPDLTLLDVGTIETLPYRLVVVVEGAIKKTAVAIGASVVLSSGHFFLPVSA